MDWLMVFVILAIVGQAALILWLRRRNSPTALKRQLADLIEAEADKQKGLPE